MNALNIARINERVPYDVWQTSEGDFNFLYQGIYHHCRGSKELHCYDCSKRQSTVKQYHQGFR